MKTTFRTMTWGYGFFVTNFLGVLALVLAWLIPGESKSYSYGFLVGSLTTTYLIYTAYWLILIRRYPVCGDLPEFKEWQFQRLKEFQESRPS